MFIKISGSSSLALTHRGGRAGTKGGLCRSGLIRPASFAGDRESIALSAFNAGVQWARGLNELLAIRRRTREPASEHKKRR